MLKYRKGGEMIFLSHLETMRTLERALRRADVPMAYTQGYSPHPKISSSPALPVGTGSEGEYLEVALEEEVDVGALIKRINLELPQGLEATELTLLPEHFPKLSRWIRYALYRIDRIEGPGDTRTLPYLLLPLASRGSGEREGSLPRLRDALARMSDEMGIDEKELRVVRQGLYASVDEVLEEVRGRILIARGREALLSEVKE